MSIASKVQQIYTGCSDIRAAINEEDSTKGSGLITSLGNQIRSLFGRKFVILWTKNNIIEDDGEGNQIVTGVEYRQEKEVVTGYMLPDEKFKNRTSIVSAILPDTITELGHLTSDNLGFCFDGCTSLEYINLEKITKIGIYGFRRTSLRDVNFKNLVQIKRGCFYQCTKLRTVTISGPITNLASGYSSGTFEGCTSLSYVDLGNIISTGRGAFYDCTSLTTVIGIDKLKTIGQETFYNCKKLGGFTLTDAESIAEEAFTYVYGPDFYLGNNIKTIGVNAFAQVSNKLNDSNRGSLAGVINLPQLTSVGKGVFQNTKITEVQSLGNITAIPDSGSYSSGLFRRCLMLTSVTLPSTLTIIGSYGFMDCSALTNVTIDGNQTVTINSYAFSGCTSLINFPFERVNYFGTNSFYYCSSIQEVTIKSGITSIGNNSFNGCSNLMTVILYAETPPTIASNVFSGGSSSRKYYVPYSEDHSILNAYQTATNWNSFASQIYELDSNGEIPL